jgi:hypothetical protein
MNGKAERQAKPPAVAIHPNLFETSEGQKLTAKSQKLVKLNYKLP